MSRFRIIALVLCTMIFVLPGRPALADAAATQSIDSDMARLLPEGAVVAVYTPSMSKMTSELTAIVKEFNQQAAGMLMFMGPQSLLKMQLNTRNKIRADMPAAIAVVPGKTLDADPDISIIFAVQGATPETVKASDKSMKMVFLEGTDWVSMTSGDSYEPRAKGSKAPAISTHMLPGIVSVAFDQALLRERFGDQLKKNMLEVMNDGSNPKAAYSKQVEAINAKIADGFIDGFDRWDMSMSFDPEMPSTTVKYTPVSGDCVMKSSPGLGIIGNHLATELPMQMVLTTDVARHMFSFARMFSDSEGEGMKKVMTTFIDNGEAFLDQVVDGAGVSMGMSDDGMNVVKVMQVKDVAKALSLVDDQMKFLNEAKWGIESEAIPVTVGAETSRAYRLKFDLEQMKKAFPGEFDRTAADSSFAGSLMASDAQIARILDAMGGPDGMIVRCISKDDWMAIVIGDAKLLGTARRALAQTTSRNAQLDKALKTATASPVMGMSMDLRGYLIGMGEFASAHPALGKMMQGQGVTAMMDKLASSPAAPIYMSSSSTENATQFTMSFDLKGMVAFVKDMESLQAEAMEKAAKEEKAGSKKDTP